MEACIKIKLKKLDVDLKEMVKSIKESGFIELPISAYHATIVCSLPDIHRDPFDRIEDFKGAIFGFFTVLSTVTAESILGQALRCRAKDKFKSLGATAANF